MVVRTAKMIQIRVAEAAINRAVKMRYSIISFMVSPMLLRARETFR